MRIGTRGREVVNGRFEPIEGGAGEPAGGEEDESTMGRAGVMTRPPIVAVRLSVLLIIYM